MPGERTITSTKSYSRRRHYAFSSDNVGPAASVSRDIRSCVVGSIDRSQPVGLWRRTRRNPWSVRAQSNGRRCPVICFLSSSAAAAALEQGRRRRARPMNAARAATAALIESVALQRDVTPLHRSWFPNNAVSRPYERY